MYFLFPIIVAPTPAQTRAPPVVCYQTDRNVLQQQLVQWLQSKEMADGWFQKGKQYLDVVDEYFQVSTLDPGGSGQSATHLHPPICICMVYHT